MALPHVQSLGRSSAHGLLAVALAAFVLVLHAGNIANYWIPYGDYGIDAQWNGIVDAVIPGFPAASLGIKPGDRIDVKSLTFSQKMIVLNAFPGPLIVQSTTSVGKTMRLQVFHAGVPRVMTMVAAPNFASIYQVIKRLAGILSTLLGLALVLLRPSRMIWGFYFFSLALTDFNPTFFWFIPAGAYFIMTIILYALYAAGPIGFLVFTLFFPTDEALGWKRAVYRAVPFVISVQVGLIIFGVISQVFALGAYGHSAITQAADALNILLQTLGILALGDTYVRASGDGRERIKWVLGGLAVFYVVNIAIYLMINIKIFLPVSTSPWVTGGWLRLADILVPLAVAYAVLRYRVIDIKFAISRALVYGLITAIIITLFSLMDSLFIKKLADTSVGIVLELAAAIAVGFWLHGLHRRTDMLIESTFFRKRHQAELRLARVASALAHVTSKVAMDEFMIEEPVDALELASAALFELAQGGEYRRNHSVGWTEGNTAVLDENDRLVLLLQAEHEVQRIQHTYWRRTDLPADAAYPSVAIPIIVRHTLVAIALYGAHSSGTDLDPDEIEALSKLAAGVSAARDHLEAQELQKRLDVAQARINSLSAALEHGGFKPGSATAN